MSGYKQVEEDDALVMYDEMLDECYGPVSICGYMYPASYAFKEVDPIAYQDGFNNWADSQEIEVI